MESRELLPLLQNAIKRKNNLIAIYGRYAASEDNLQLRPVMEDLLKKEKYHLELLHKIRENVQNGVEIPTEAFAGANLFDTRMPRQQATSVQEVSYQTDRPEIDGVDQNPRTRIRYSKNTVINR